MDNDAWATDAVIEEIAWVVGGRHQALEIIPIISRLITAETEACAKVASAVKHGAIFKLLEIPEPTDAQTDLQMLVSKIGAEITDAISARMPPGR